MPTQLQRALGFGRGKEAVPKSSEAKAPKKEARSDRKGVDKGGDKGDPYPNLPRRPFGRDIGA